MMTKWQELGEEENESLWNGIKELEKRVMGISFNSTWQKQRDREVRQVISGDAMIQGKCV